MRYRKLIATGVATTAGLALAGSAMAAPDISAVEVIRHGKHGLEVDVESARGTSTAKPRIYVNVARRWARAHVRNWDAALVPTDTVNGTAKLKRVRAPIGSTLTVRVRACDTTCATTTHTETVLAQDPDDAPPPLPSGSIDAMGAVTIALNAVGADSTLIGVEREDAYGAAWEVKVLRSDGARVKVLVAADGSVRRIQVPAFSGVGWKDHHPEWGPLPAGSISAQAAASLATSTVGTGSVVLEVERKHHRGPVLWEITVQRADGAIVEVEISATGTVLSQEVKD